MFKQDATMAFNTGRLVGSKFSTAPRSADNFDERLVREAVWAAVEIFGLQRAALCLVGTIEHEEEVAEAA